MVAPNLNDPVAQEQYAREEEARRARQAELDAGTARGAAAANEGGAGVVNGIWNAADDFFSAETVNAPGKGAWGASGTAAAGYNAAAAATGARANQNAQAQGQGALQNAMTQGATAGTAAAQQSNNLLGQAGGVASRAAPITNYAGADQYANKGDSARDFANNLVNQAGDSSKQEQQLAALNEFAKGPGGPSAAQAQLAQAGDAAQLSALSMARSGRGAGDSASALRDATFSNATTQGQTAGQMATLRANEEATKRQQQLQALEAAMGGAGAIRGADTSAAGVAQNTRAQDLAAQQQAANQSQFNTSTALTSQGQNDATRLGLINSALGFTNTGNQTNLGFNQLGQQTNLGFAGLGQQAQTDMLTLGQNALTAQSDYELQQQQMALDAAKANQQADLEKDSGISGMIGGAVGAIGMLSDERQKKLKRKERALAESLGALDTLGDAPASSYEYKDPSLPGASPGRHVSSMAQDLERGPRGAEIVHETPNGKMVDYEAVMKMTPGAITELNRKVKALEKALGGKAA